MSQFDSGLFDTFLFDDRHFLSLAGQTGGAGWGAAVLTLEVTLQGTSGGTATCAGVLGFLTLPRPSTVRVGRWLGPGW